MSRKGRRGARFRALTRLRWRWRSRSGLVAVAVALRVGRCGGRARGGGRAAGRGRAGVVAGGRAPWVRGLYGAAQCKRPETTPARGHLGDISTWGMLMSRKRRRSARFRALTRLRWRGGGCGGRAAGRGGAGHGRPADRPHGRRRRRPSKHVPLAMSCVGGCPPSGDSRPRGWPIDPNSRRTSPEGDATEAISCTG